MRWEVAGSVVGAVVLAMGVTMFAADSMLVPKLQPTDATDRDWWKSEVSTGDRIDWQLQGRRKTGGLVAMGPVAWLLARQIERQIGGRCPSCG